MSCLMVVDLICPKCGGPVVWCNGDFSSQFKATCLSCGYEDCAVSFPKGKELTVEERMRLFSKLAHSRKPDKGK